MPDRCTATARSDQTDDARILDVLQRDGRRPYADLGAEVGMSGPSAHERVKKLEARGVIRGYAAVRRPGAPSASASSPSAGSPRRRARRART